jgi:anhydro-N-acetylmuramic acid kinase
MGLMSGTSMDGIDAALLRTDGESITEFGPAITRPYTADLRERIRSVLGGQGPVMAVSRAITEAHAEAATALLAEAGMKAGEVAMPACRRPCWYSISAGWAMSLISAATVR